MRLRALGVAVLLGTVLSTLPAAASHPAFTQVVTGTWHTCGLTGTGNVMCWGNNDFGQLGDGTTLLRTRPTPVVGLPSGQIVDVAAGWGHTCALTTSGDAFCWGYGGYGQLGNGSLTFTATTPVAVVPAGGLVPGTIADLESDDLHTCAVTTSAAAYCWGMNRYGQLGDGTTTDSALPVAVSTGAGLLPGTVASLSAGGEFTCATTHAAEAFCWGINRFGQLGDGTTTDSSVPVRVAAGAGLAPGTVAMVSSGTFHTCAVSTGGNAFCWGYNWEGRLGTGGTMSSTVPAAVVPGAGLTPGQVASIGAGGYHSCAVTRAGDVFCWGNNDSGELGEGTVMLDRTAPVAVHQGTGLTGVREISVGFRHTCASTATAHAFCWGEGLEGQRGDGTVAPSPVPLEAA